MPQIKAPQPSKKAEREFTAVIESMVAAMAKQFRNQTLNELNKGDVEKFTDAKTGNFAAVWVQLANRASRKLKARFDEKRIKQTITKMLDRQDKDSASRLYAEVERVLGVPSKQLLATEGMSIRRNALTLETVQWVKKLRDETLQEWTAATLRSMAEGESLEQVMQQFDGMVEKRRNHAKFVARTQIGTYNSLMTKARAQNIGIEKAVWVTSKDERVRHSHKVRDGKEFELSKGLYSSTDGQWLLPANDYQCRCSAMLLLD